LFLVLGSGTARGVEVRPLVAPDGAAKVNGTAPPEVTSVYRQKGDARDVVEVGEGAVDDSAEDALEPPVAFATNGTYTGTVGGKPFTLTVSGNKITSWKVENLECPSFTITQASVSTSCNVAGNDSFTCGALGCSAAGNMRIAGSFGGSSVSGTFDADFQPPSLPCCSFRNLAFSAALSGGGTPAAPSNLVATAASDHQVNLGWTDNSSSETEFRVEARTGSAGSFTDIGGVGANAIGASVTGLDPSTLYNFRVRAHNATGYSDYSNIAAATTLGGSTGPCVADDTTLCLSGGRFQVRATFRTSQPQTGQAHAVGLTADTGYLWFFADTNVEVVVKVLNACSFNSRFWVYAGGLTDVEVIMTVTDTQTGTVKQYTNPLGTKFAPIQDSSAFATCP
jgi:hypothetical protein